MALRHSQQQPVVNPCAEAPLLAEVRVRTQQIAVMSKMSCNYQNRRQLNNLSEDGWTKNPGDARNKASYFNFFFQANGPKVIAPEKNLCGTNSRTKFKSRH